MKTFIWLLIILLSCTVSFAQFKIKTAMGEHDIKDKIKTEFADKVTSFQIMRAAEEPPKKYVVKMEADTNNFIIGNFFSDGAYQKIDFSADLRDKYIGIFYTDDETGNEDELAGFTLPSSKPAAGSSMPLQSEEEFFRSLFPQLLYTEYGIILGDKSGASKFTGKKFIHIFLDQSGNCINTTIPQGIADRQYVVHIVYLTNEDTPRNIDYSITQTEGEFDGTLIFNSTTGLKGFAEGYESRSADEEEAKKTKYVWRHKEILLSTSTKDIKFDVYRNTIKQGGQFFETEKQMLSSYIIKMSKVYHGTINMGILNSTLENPSYELISSPSGSDEKVVKKSDDGNRGVLTVMATFYTSPVIILEKIINSNVPDYKLTGRNFLDDHEWYERIYPTVGVGISEKVFDNLFYGFSFEFARGGSIFFGLHYGKINTFDDTNLIFGETVINEGGFRLKQNTIWHTKYAMGLNVDLMIALSLFKFN